MDIDEDKATKDELKRHHSFLDLPLNKGCVYLLNNRAAKDLVDGGRDATKVKEILEKGSFKKAQVAYIIEVNSKSTNESIDEEIEIGINNIIEYYNYVLGIKHSKI